MTLSSYTTILCQVVDPSARFNFEKAPIVLRLVMGTVTNESLGNKETMHLSFLQNSPPSHLNISFYC